MPALDVDVSIDTNQILELRRQVDDVWAATTMSRMGPTDEEAALAQNVHRSLVAAFDISKGTYLSREMLLSKRPGSGIPTQQIDRVIGKKATRNIKSGEMLKAEDVAW
jgi:N,N'-diacetyllegionaminate synthase